MKLIYNVEDKPQVSERIVFAFQQLLAIMAATIAVPAIVGNGMTASAALFGAGVGTLVYQLFTKFRSPVFLGSSFAFLGSMFAAFAGGVSMSLGFLGLILGAVFAGLVYVVFALIVKASGVQWINRLMPAVIIGPIVAIIGLSLAGNAVGDMVKGDGPATSPYVALICALVTLFVVIICSVYGSKKVRLIPFIIGILAGYFCASLFALIGNNTGNESLVVINYAALHQVGTIISLPDFSFMKADWSGVNGAYLVTLFVAYAPVAFVVFAEHLADHKNLSSIVGVNLLEEPGLTRTLLGDGVGSFVGAFFGGCPNTTYGESIATVAITRNASTVSIWGAAFACILFSLITPLVAFLETIPNCVMGGVCIALYGFIAASGLKMLQPVDLNKNRNLFVASVIFIVGVGGMTVNFGRVEIRTVACALILGILTNVMLSKEKDEA